MNKKRIPKLIIVADEIKSDSGWGLKQEEQMFTCQDCGGMIFYVKKILGVVAEELDIGIMGWRCDRNYSIREIGIDVYCAECGSCLEYYHSFSYDKESVVCEYKDIEGEEICEIEYCLRQFNEKGDFKSSFKSGESRLLKEKLLNYEKKHPVKVKKVRKVKKGKMKGGGKK